MRMFAILLFSANLLYLGWSLLLSESDEDEGVMIRSPSRQAPSTLQLQSEIDQIGSVEEELGEGA